LNTVQARKRRKEGGATKGNSDHHKKKRRYIIHNSRDRPGRPYRQLDTTFHYHSPAAAPNPSYSSPSFLTHLSTHSQKRHNKKLKRNRKNHTNRATNTPYGSGLLYFFQIHIVVEVTSPAGAHHLRLFAL
jgi:hypothetical protein